MSVYSDFETIVEDEIVDTIRKSGMHIDEIDIQSFAEEVISFDEVAGGYVLNVSPTNFWIILDNHYKD